MQDHNSVCPAIARGEYCAECARMDEQEAELGIIANMPDRGFWIDPANYTPSPGQNVLGLLRNRRTKAVVYGIVGLSLTRNWYVINGPAPAIMTMLMGGDYELYRWQHLPEPPEEDVKSHPILRMME